MFDKALFKLPGMHGLLAALALSSLAQAALVIGQTLCLAEALSNLWDGQPAADQAALLAGFAACFALRRIVLLVQEEGLESYARARTGELRSRILAATFGEDASLARQMGTAATALAASDGLDDVARYLRVMPPKALGLACITAPVLVALFALDWVSGLIALVSFPVVIAFMVMLGRQAQARAERQFAESTRLSNHFIDTLRGLESIQALDACGQAAESVYGASEGMRRATVRTLSVATLSSSVLDLISVFGIAAIAMMLAFRLLDGSMALATALPALMLAPECFMPVRAFAGDFHASLDGRNALAAISAIIGQGDAEAAREGESRAQADTAIGSFEAHRIGFSHDGAKGALDGVSFVVPGNAIVGIVGESGAGKSTLADLLAGFRAPDAGTFRVNGRAAKLNGPGWKRRLHYVPQHPHVFRMTLEENIRLYAPQSSREDVERAVRLAGLERLVEDLPNGLSTVIGEAGRGLSGGEAQRVALARMLLDDRDVLVFDEPTAHLDIETELELKERMLPHMQGKLVFFATHRMHWVADMDYVIVLENGAVAEAGPPCELLAGHGALRRLVDDCRREVSP